MANLNDDKVAAILADMIDSQAPIKSPAKRAGRRHPVFSACPQASTDPRGLQNAAEQNRPFRGLTLQDEKVALRTKRTRQQRLLSRWSSIPDRTQSAP